MPYIPVLNDILEARFITFDPTPPVQVGINVLRWKVVAGGTLTNDLPGIAQALDVRFQAEWKAALSTTVTYRGVLVTKVFPGVRPAAGSYTGNAGVGTFGANQTPTQVAGLIKLTTDRAGRAFRGRLYMPFLGATAIQANGNLTLAYLATLNAIAAKIATFDAIDGFANSTRLTPVIWHRKGYGKPPGAIGSSDPITGATGSPLLATVRRRGNYGRVNASSPI